MKHTITLTTPIQASFRTAQIAGMFDVPVEEKLTQTIEYEEPPLGSGWSLGCIVGPSGSGKTTIAKQIAEDLAKKGAGVYLNTALKDPAMLDKPVIDLFAPLPVKETAKLLTLAGFSSPPSWLKPYRVLSNGEKFRIDLARALNAGAAPFPTDPPPLVLFDEYTSVVDRTTAQMGSLSLNKAIRTGKINCRFLAVTCHDDVVDFLEPDWVLDTSGGCAALTPRSCGAVKKNFASKSIAANGIYGDCLSVITI